MPYTETNSAFDVPSEAEAEADAAAGAEIEAARFVPHGKAAEWRKSNAEINCPSRQFAERKSSGQERRWLRFVPFAPALSGLIRR